MPDIDSVDIIVVPPGTPPLAEGERAEQEEAADLDLQRRKLDLADIRQDIDLRREYANRLRQLISIWLLAVLVVVVAQGALSPWGFFTLSENVILALIGGTTVNVLGIFAIVVNYLFPKRNLPI